MATISVPDLMRQAQTNSIAAYLKQRQQGTGFLGPPITAPPSTDPFTPDPGGTSLLGPPIQRPPVTSEPGSWRHTPPVSETSPAAMSYEALMRSAGRPIDQFTPYAMQSGEGPQLPGGAGPPEPGILPGNLGPPIGAGGTPAHPNYYGPPPSGPNTDPYGIDPAGESATNRYNSNQPHDYMQDWQNVNYLMQGRFGSPGGNVQIDPTNSAPGDYSGGPVGTGTTDPRQWWNQTTEPGYGKAARALVPYGIGQIIHGLMGAYRNSRNTGGTVGGAAHQVGGTPQQVVTPSYAGPNQHFDYAAGKYVPNSQTIGSPSDSLTEMAQQSYGGAPNNSRGTGDQGHNLFNNFNTGGRTHGMIDPETGSLNVIQNTPAWMAGWNARFKQSQLNPTANQNSAVAALLNRNPLGAGGHG